MFGIAWSEIAVILVVALVVMDPKDIPSVIKSVREFFAKLQDYKHEMMSVIHDIDHEALGGLKQEAANLNQELRKIVDLEGNVQDAYDLPEIRKELTTDHLIAKLESVDVQMPKKPTLH